MNNITINNIQLDNTQMEAIKAKEKAILVIAGAGSGKTLTIEGKIKYLIENENIKEDEILCISFTNETVNNLHNKLLKEGYNIEVKTFHKLGLKFLKDKNYTICSDSLLPFIVDEYFESYIKYNKKNIRIFKNIFYTNNSFEKISKTYEYTSLKKLIITFIKLAKSNNITIKEIYKIYKHSFFKEKQILKYILDILVIYKNELQSQNKIDMDDIIIESKKYVRKYNLKYKQIIIDEYQDSSIIRLELIKEIIKYTNASLFVVGDDFQSIYRFSGCNLDLFINFNKYFKETKYIYLKHTYRNSNELIYVSVRFITKNKKQLKKEIISNKNNPKPIKILINYTVEDAINLIGKEKEILVLGRNNKDIENIRYENKLTIHRSKGLESEEVLLVNSDNIPSKIKNEELLRHVTISKEYYPYEEERRLFYVALTRTKNNVYILVKNKSLFIKEIIKDYKKYIEIKKKN